MPPPIPQELKAKAQVFYGHKDCTHNFSLFLSQMGLLPTLLNNLTLLDTIQECGFVKDRGFVWLKLKSKTQHRLHNNLLICFDKQVTAYVEPHRIRNLTGVKASKDFFLCVTLTDILIQGYRKPGQEQRIPGTKQGDSGNTDDVIITFKTVVGLSVSFPFSVFMPKTEEEEEKGTKIKKYV